MPIHLILYTVTRADGLIIRPFIYLLLSLPCFIIRKYVTIGNFRSYETSYIYKEDLPMGKIFRFHSDVDTDQIIASQYILFPTIDEMKTYAFESLDPTFASRVQPGDFIVACENFGCGSSREQAPGVLKALGVKAVIAKSFARIFYRNAINIGLPVIVCKELYDQVADQDHMELLMQEGLIRANGQTFTCTKLPDQMQRILDQGGLIASLNKED